MAAEGGQAEADMETGKDSLRDFIDAVLREIKPFAHSVIVNFSADVVFEDGKVFVKREGSNVKFDVGVKYKN